MEELCETTCLQIFAACLLKINLTFVKYCYCTNFSDLENKCYPEVNKWANTEMGQIILYIGRDTMYAVQHLPLEKWKVNCIITLKNWKLKINYIENKFQNILNIKEIVRSTRPIFNAMRAYREDMFESLTFDEGVS